MRPAASLNPRIERLVVAVLLAVAALQLLVAIRSDGMTVDELVYIGCGYRHLRYSDFRMNPEQPPAAKMLAALPLLALPVQEPPPPVGDDQIGWPDRFLHEVNRDRPLLSAARLPIAACTILLAVLLWRVARSTGGVEAGLFALALAAFHPSLLAHGHLATTDALSALTFAASSAALWHWSRAPRAVRALVVALAFGAAVTTRLTAWLLPMTFLPIVLLWLYGQPRDRRRAAWRALAQLAAIGAVVVPLVIWTLYGFHYTPWPGEPLARTVDPALGFPGRVVAQLHEWRALPEAYLEGVRYQLEHNRQGHTGYLNGERGSGWRHYYLVAYAVKNTPGFLLATALAATALWRARIRWLSGPAEIHWMLPAVTIFTVASAANIQLGERYVLAIYPYVILLAAAAVPALVARRAGRYVIAVVLALHVFPALSTAGRGYLAYFNALGGGPDGGHRLLADSNLDWGQDLPRLAAWMKANRIERIQLGYFGSDDPDRYGIEREDLPTWGANRPQRPAAVPFRGTIAVSPNLLVGLFFPPDADPYAFLRGRPPDDRAGVFFIYHLPR